MSAGLPRPYLSGPDLERYGASIERSFRKYVTESGETLFDVSDKRGQSVVRECLQCGKTARLLLSHVFPSWSGDAHRDEGGFLLGKVREDSEKEVLSQDLNKHYLLCAECEQFYGVSERYCRALSRGDMDELTSLGIGYSVGNLLDNVNEDLVLRFVASILLRSHAAASAAYLRLSDAQVVLLRELIRDSRWSPENVLLMCAKVYSAIPDTNARAIIDRTLVEHDGFVRFEMVLGGMYWILLLRDPGAHSPEWGGELREMLFESSLRNGEMTVLPADVLDLNLVKRGLGHSMTADLKKAPLLLDSRCACGWTDSTLRDCCAGTWLASELNDVQNEGRPDGGK